MERGGKNEGQYFIQQYVWGRILSRKCRYEQIVKTIQENDSITSHDNTDRFLLAQMFFFLNFMDYFRKI